MMDTEFSSEMSVSGVEFHVPAALPSGKEPPVINKWLVGWASRAGLDAVEKRKSLSPLPGIELLFLGRPARTLLDLVTELSQLVIPIRRLVGQELIQLNVSYEVHFNMNNYVIRVYSPIVH
jgi:hypothetical protein